MKLTPARRLLLATLLPLSTLSLFGADADQPMTAAQAAQLESVKRKDVTFAANQAVVDGQRLLNSKNYDEAAARYQFVIDNVSSGGSTAGLYKRAAAGLAAAKAGQTEELAKEGKFAQAAQLLQEAIVLQPNEPVYVQDLEDLKRQQVAWEQKSRDPEGTFNNPAVTDDFKAKVATVQRLLVHGDSYFKTGQYDLAEETYSKILILDPYNKAARDKMAHVQRYQERAAEFRHKEHEEKAMETVSHGWAEDISPDLVIPPTTSQTVNVYTNRAKITRKLQSIIIDKVNFDKLDINTVIQFLQDKSKELDLPSHEGVNFVLRLSSNTPPPTPPADAAAAPTGAAPAAPAPPPAQIHREVSISLDNVPLSELLNYITGQTNLQFTVEDYAVYLRPNIDEGDTLTVRTFLVPANFFQGRAAANVTSIDAANITTGSVAVKVSDELVAKGIAFPNGATATFLPASSKLVVRNTPEQLDLIANLIENLSNKETPQVLIEAKLVEFNQDALKSLTFNYQVGTALIGGTPMTPFNPNFGVQTALRTADPTSPQGIGGLTANSIDTLIQENTSSLTTSVFPITGTNITPNTPNVFVAGAILDGTGLLAVMEAINNTKGVSVMSAPSVTTQRGQVASVDFVREFPYPISFEKPKLSSSETEYSGFSQRPEFEGAALEMAIPPTPREFKEQDIGVSLEVKPTTYPDQRIDLDITKAQVVDFDGFIDYGVPIRARLDADAPPADQEGTILTEGTINQPVFNVRSVVTKLQVLDGQTAVLGGLIREDTQEINDKVPVLGDLPLIGRLFQSKVSERTKKHLLIFVTAKLVRSNGKPQYVRTLEAQPIEEKLPDPEPIGSGINLPLLPEGKPNS